MAKAPRVSRLALAQTIQEWMGQGIGLRKVYRAMNLIIEQIANDLVNDEVVTVRRFGTLSPHMRWPHEANNVNTGKISMVEAKRSVQFHPHEAFKALIKHRQEQFRSSDD